MKQYVFDYANDIIATNKNNVLMRDGMRSNLELYVDAVLDDYKQGFITTDEALYLLARPDKII